MIESEAAGQKIFGEPQPATGYGNFLATTAPTVNDDEEAGYSINSTWYKATYPYRLWINTDNATGAAVWREIPLLVTSNRTLFDHYTDATTAGTSRETLYTDTLHNFALYQDGDKIMFRYAGIYVVGLNSSELFLEAFGTDIAASGPQTGNGASWSIEGWVIRVSNSAVRYSSTFVMSGTTVTTAAEITGLDLIGTFAEFNLDAETPGTNGDVIAALGTAWFVPAAPVPPETDYWTLLGDRWVLNGDPWAFNP